MHILDWRERAREFGLLPGGGDDSEAVVEPPDRLIQEEEPEALESQPIEEFRREQPADRDDTDDGSAEDVDLVRVYLQQIGRRKLLKARDEQEIGARIERTRGELLAALGTIPAARRTLLALAECVRQGSAPAAELILLPDGGELKPENVEPVLRALTRVRWLETRIDQWHRHCADRRSTAASRARFRREIGRADTAMAALLRDLPIRPSVVDDLVQELTRLEDEFEQVPGIEPASARTAARRGLERRAGLPAEPERTERRLVPRGGQLRGVTERVGQRPPGALA